MRKLPKVSQLVEQITQHVTANQQEMLRKEASDAVVEYIVPVARKLKKVAELCRATTPGVSISEVEAFGQRLMRSANGNR